MNSKRKCLMPSKRPTLARTSVSTSAHHHRRRLLTRGGRDDLAFRRAVGTDRTPEQRETAISGTYARAMTEVPNAGANEPCALGLNETTTRNHFRVGLRVLCSTGAISTKSGGRHAAGT